MKTFFLAWLVLFICCFQTDRGFRSTGSNLSSVITLCHPNPDSYLSFFTVLKLVCLREKKCNKSLGRRKQLAAEENYHRWLDFLSLFCVFRLRLFCLVNVKCSAMNKGLTESSLQIDQHYSLLHEVTVQWCVLSFP